MKVERLPSTGETLLGTGYRVDYGGKGSNQAVGCARLGAKVSFVAKIGKDAFGEMALGLYRDEGIDAAYVKQTVDAPTGVGFIVVEAASGSNCIVLVPGANELFDRCRRFPVRGGFGFVGGGTYAAGNSRRSGRGGAGARTRARRGDRCPVGAWKNRWDYWTMVEPVA
jgi:hypothetical protein